jgi:hypothetical protein
LINDTLNIQAAGLLFLANVALHYQELIPVDMSLIIPPAPFALLAELL